VFCNISHVTTATGYMRNKNAEIISKSLRRFISQVTTSETEIKQFQPLR